MLFTVAGVPSVYYGDEFAMTGVKEQRLGGDDAVRPEFPQRPPTSSELDQLDPAAAEVLHAHQALVALRRRHPWLVRARSEVVHVSNTAIVVRTATGAGAVVTALNVDDDIVALPAADAGNLVCGRGHLDGGSIELPRRGWAVLEAAWLMTAAGRHVRKAAAGTEHGNGCGHGHCGIEGVYQADRKVRRV